MFKEIFIGKPIAHFRLNPIVKSFIVSETFLWAAWNTNAPIFSIFAATQIPGGSAEVAAFVFSVHILVRVVFELASGRYLSQSSETKKFITAIAGTSLLSIAYLGFSYTQTAIQLYFFAGLTGMGLGIATPAKNSLFSLHLDKSKESFEWGMYDATVFMAMALAAIVGGFIATNYGFPLLFQLAAVVNAIAIIPYFLYISKNK